MSNNENFIVNFKNYSRKEVVVEPKRYLLLTYKTNLRNLNSYINI